MAIKVLVLDDELQWHEILEEVLCNEGYEVEITSTFEQARHLLEHNRYHLAVLDLVLSGDVIVEGQPSGSDLLPLIHSFYNDPNRLCGVVILTGNATKENAIRDLEENLPFLKDAVSPVILKRGQDGNGFKPQELLQACQSVIRKVLLERNRLYNENKYTLLLDLRRGKVTGIELAPTGSSIDSANEFKVDIDAYSDRADDLQFHFSPRLSDGYDDWRKRAKKIGENLYHELFATDSEMLVNFVQARDMSNKPLHLVFRGAPEMLRLPLELLTDGDAFLVGKNPLTRRISNIRASRKHGIGSRFLEKTSPIKILLIGSNTRPPINGADWEIDFLYQSLPKLFESRGFKCQPLVVPTAEATLDHVKNLLEDCQYHIIHYAGHGFHIQDRADESGLVFWERTDVKERWLPLPIRTLARLLEHSDTRFFFLSCCVGAKEAPEAHKWLRGQHFQGMLDAIVRSGVPAVLGYRWNLGDSDAPRFSLSFYENLLDYLDLDLAIFKARQALQESEYHNETWASPILVAQNL